jgi:hypothetical protein
MFNERAIDVSANLIYAQLGVLVDVGLLEQGEEVVHEVGFNLHHRDTSACCG